MYMFIINCSFIEGLSGYFVKWLVQLFNELRTCGMFRLGNNASYLPSFNL